MMRNARSFGLSVALSLALGAGSFAAVGCGGTVEEPQTQASAVTKAPIAPQSHGVVKVFGDALGEVALRPEQRTALEKLAVTAEARHVAMADGKKDLMLSVADQIERGSIDRAALQPKIDRIVSDLEKARPEDGADLAKVHDILDPDQRNAFVDALETKFKSQRAGKHQGEKSEASEHAGGMGGLRQLADDLKLTDDQKSQIKDALKGAHDGHAFRQMHERMSHGKEVFDSFRTEKFDVAAASPPADKVRANAAEGTSHIVSVAEKVLPILTPEQRKIAADKLRTMASAGGDLPFAH
jgi:Spy/CpxP family protein refolding chaperone